MKTLLATFGLFVLSSLSLSAASDISNFAGRYRIIHSENPRGIRVKVSPTKEWGGFYLYYLGGVIDHFSFRNRRFEFKREFLAFEPKSALGSVTITPNRIAFRSMRSPDGYTVSGRIVRTASGFRLIYTLNGTRFAYTFLKIGD
jgi:hypothetical protein